MFDYLFDEEGNISWSRALLTLAIVFIVVGAGSMVFDSVATHALEARLANDKILADQTARSVVQAKDEVVKYSLGYADHWSASQASSLLAAEKNFAQTGDIYKNFAIANEAFAKGDRNSAKDYADKAEQLIRDAQVASNAILGPPDLYQQLADWSSQADSTIASAQSCIPTNQAGLIAFQSSDNFARGAEDLVNAQNLLTQAVAANTTAIERGIVDKPQAYQFAQQSLASCNRALTDAAPTPPTPVPSSHSDSPIIIINNGGSGGSDPSSDWSSPNPTTSDPWSSPDWSSSPSADPGYSDPWSSPTFDNPDTGTWDQPTFDGGGGDSGSWDSSGDW